MNVLVFGTGDFYKNNRHKFENLNILAFLDNDVKKQGLFMDDVIITGPENHHRYTYDAIILASVYFSEMRLQLLDLGVPADKIVDEKHAGIFAEICEIQEYKSDAPRNENGKKILLVSNELSNTGAPTALYNVARILVTKGYTVDLITCINGPMIHRFLSLGVEVKIAGWWEMFDNSMLGKYDLLFLNTALTYPIAQKMAGTNTPLIWWWHETVETIRFCKIESKDIPIAENIHLLSVGPKVKAAYWDLREGAHIDELCLGIPYHESSEKKNAHNKVICAIIGYVLEVKGHDLLLKAVELNQKKWDDKIEFWIIGSINEKQRAEFEQYSSIKVWGVLEHDELMDLFSEIDIVLCASRYESLSLVIVEGMMHRKLCITSSAAGIADYCIPYENALIMESGSVESLSEQIDWALQHPEEWEQIAAAGYEVYHNTFRMEAFEKNLLYYVDKYCL